MMALVLTSPGVIVQFPNQIEPPDHEEASLANTIDTAMHQHTGTDVADFVGPYTWAIIEEAIKSFPCPPCAEEGGEWLSMIRDAIKVKTGRQSYNQELFLKKVLEIQALADQLEITQQRNHLSGEFKKSNTFRLLDFINQLADTASSIDYELKNMQFDRVKDKVASRDFIRGLLDRIKIFQRFVVEEVPWQQDSHLSANATKLDIAGDENSQFIREHLRSSSSCHEDSFRTIAQGDHRLVLCCTPKQWTNNSEKCRLGQIVQARLHPRSEMEELVAEAKRRGIEVVDSELISTIETVEGMVERELAKKPKFRQLTRRSESNGYPV